VNCGPIFIGGLGRSGKTLMRFMLSSHPNIVMSRRTNMWTTFYNRYGDLSRGDSFERCLDAMLQRKHVALLRPDPERIRQDFWRGAPTYARLFALLHEHYAEQEGKPRWGDQTELIESRADLVLAAYPGSRMIHMVRDPRDRYEAALARRPQGRGKVGGATAMWLYSVGMAKRNQARYPDRYLTVRYETMVREPEENLRKVCAFLDEEFSPAMLTMEDIPRFQRSGVGPEQSPISTEYIGRFRQRTSGRELAFMQAFAGRDMLAYGYDLEEIQLSFRDRLLLYLIDGPVNLARMVAWRAQELVRRKLPARPRRGLVPTTASRRCDDRQQKTEPA
jgi:hypothetical protein